MTKLRQAEKIVKEMEGMDKPVVIITKDISPLAIMMEMVKSIIPENFATLSLQEKLATLESSKEEGAKLMSFEDGSSRIFILPALNVSPLEIQVKLMACLLEHPVKKVFCDPNEILFGGLPRAEELIESWEVYKEAICKMYDLEFITITDDFGGKSCWL